MKVGTKFSNYILTGIDSFDFLTYILNTNTVQCIVCADFDIDTLGVYRGLFAIIIWFFLWLWELWTKSENAWYKKVKLNPVKTIIYIIFHYFLYLNALTMHYKPFHITHGTNVHCIQVSNQPFFSVFTLWRIKNYFNPGKSIVAAVQNLWN